MSRDTSRWARTLRRLLGIAPCWITIVAIASSSTPIIAKLIVAAVAAATLWNPAEGLLLAAGLAPLGAFFAALFDFGSFRLTEAILVAFIGGWLVRPSASTRTEGPRMPRYAVAAGWFFAAIVVGSAIGVGSQLSRYPGELRRTFENLAWSYYLTSDPIGIVEGAKLVEGFAVAAATIEVFRQRPALAMHLPAALGASAVCAALTSALLWLGIGPDQILAQHARIGYRIAAHVADLNAAGSYFALVLCLALGMGLREAGRRQVVYLVAGVACVFGLWLCGSRTALAAVGIVVAMTAVWAFTSRWRPLGRAALLIGLLAAMIAGGVLRIQRLERDPSYRGSGFRGQFTEASLRVIAARPWFGVGVGQYARESTLFLTPQLAWTYGSENAHNNFLQIACEAGLVGIALFMAWLAGPIHRAAGALSRTPRDWRLVGALAGVLAFLGSCLTGHPLLVAEVASAFWWLLGLAGALGSSTLLNARAGVPDVSPPVASRARSVLWPAVTAFGVLLLVALPALALRQPLAPASSRAVDGFYEWETGEDGVRFRWTEQYASLFVPADVTRVDVPMRAPKEDRSRTPMVAEIAIGGITRGRFVVTDEWRTIPINLAPPGLPVGFNRINLQLNRTWRPALFVPGSADMRRVGIQVGECRLLRGSELVTRPDQ